MRLFWRSMPGAAATRITQDKRPALPRIYFILLTRHAWTTAVLAIGFARVTRQQSSNVTPTLRAYPIPPSLNSDGDVRARPALR